MKIAIVLYDRLTALDAIGPYEVLSRLPGAELSFVGAQAGPVRTDSGTLTLLAEHAVADRPDPDIVLVPGGRARSPSGPEVSSWIGFGRSIRAPPGRPRSAPAP